MDIAVVRNVKKVPLSSRQINEWSKRLLQLCKREGLKRHARLRLKKATSLTIVFVDKKEGQKLNRTYRGKKTATDVLSFSPVEEGSLGELVFCVPILKQQAREHKLKLREEFIYLFIHGFLHLLGYDHEVDDKSAREMFDLQDYIFDQMVAHS